MSDPSPSHTDTLLESCILALEAGDQQKVEAVLAANPDVAPVLRQRLDQLAAFGILHAPPSAAPVPEQLGEFRLLRQIGRGGMGIVYLAEQTSLQRQVALKLVHPEQLLFRDARERFRREVLAVARLQHPGIVPILTCGEAGGIPFYAMELVQGASLAEVLQEVAGCAASALDGTALRSALQRAMAKKHDLTPVKDAPMFQGAWAWICCRLVHAAAVALQHAHEQRVWHRDLKPSNLLLTATGEVRIIDFGLAYAEGEQRITRSHATFGSVPYMAPEQVRGDADRQEALSDIYALGVTLYELLTLTLPHGDGTGTTRERILAGDVEPPARRNPAVHADADAVCLMAMDVDPARRYASASALADDLNAFLERRTVRARRPSRLLRTARWGRRHPSRAAIAVVGFLVLVPGPILFGVQQNVAAARIQRALDEADAQRLLAEHNFEQAMLAVDQMLFRTAANRLVEHPRTAALRKSLLEDAIGFHERLLENTPGDHSNMRVRTARARSQVRLGALHMELADLPRAIAILSEGRATLEELLPLVPAANRTIVCYELAMACQRLGAATDRLGKNSAGLAHTRRALQLFEQLRIDAPDNERVATSHHDCALDLIGTLGQARQFDEANGVLHALEAELQHPPPAHYSTVFARAWRVDHIKAAECRGVLLTLAGQSELAEQAFRDGIDRFHALPAELQQEHDVEAAHVDMLERLGQICLQRREWDQATTWLDTAKTALEAIVAREPDLPRWRSQLAAVLSTRANTRTELRDFAAAEPDHDQAIELQRQVVAEAPTEQSFRRRLAIAHGHRASVRFALGKPEAALTDLEASAREFEHVLAQNPEDEVTRANLAATLANRARTLARLRKLGEARILAEAAIEIATARQAGERDRALVELYVLASELAMQQHDHATGQSRMQQATALVEAWLAERPEDPLRLGTAALVAINRGTMHLQLREPAAAAVTWTAALPTARAAAGHGPFGKQMLAVLLLRLAEGALGRDDLPKAREWFAAARSETDVRRELVRGHPSLVALFDRPEFEDLVAAPGDADK